MSGSSRSGFTWKEVADILRVSENSNAAIFRREIKHQKKGRLRAQRAPAGAKDQQRSSNQARLRQPGASRQS
jgi:hypothetical protein